jgi:hypothetical protein
VTGFLVHGDKLSDSKKRINLLTKSVTATFSGKTVKSFRSGGIFAGSKMSIRCGLKSKEFRNTLRHTDTCHNNKLIEKLDECTAAAGKLDSWKFCYNMWSQKTRKCDCVHIYTYIQATSR